MRTAGKLKVYPLTPERWDDLEKLFGQRGACGGCWCMYWRLLAAKFECGKGQSNKRALKKIVTSGGVPGLLAYRSSEAIGWCSLGPREDYPRLERSRILKRVDDEPVWSVTCLFIAKPYRRQGVSVELLQAAVAYATRQDAGILEGYPFEPKSEDLPGAFVWTGLVSAYRQAGFVEVARRSSTRPIMRYFL